MKGAGHQEKETRGSEEGGLHSGCTEGYPMAGCNYTGRSPR